MTKSPGPIILAVALFLLALGAGGLAYLYPDAVAEINAFNAGTASGKPTLKLKPEALDASLAAWNSPMLWVEPTSKHHLFNSSVDYLFFPSLYPSGNFVQANDGTARSPGDVLLSWYQKYEIDIQGANVDRADPDGDGFSNIVEYKNEQIGERLKASDCDGSKSTNPKDAKSHPPYLARLRLQKYDSRPFRITFRSYSLLDGEYRFQLYLKDVPSDKQPPLLKKGDPLGSEGYVVGEFKLNVVKEVNPQTHIEEEVDKSTLELVKPDIGLTTVVPFRKEIDSAESTANFVMLMPDDIEKVYKVARGKILTLAELPGKRYLVIEANDNGAKVRDMESKEEYHILKLDPAEWDEVPVSSTNPPPKSP